MGWGSEELDCPYCESPDCGWKQGWDCQRESSVWGFLVVGLAGVAVGCGLTLLYQVRKE